MLDLSEVHAVQQLIARFANSFDLKAWDDLAACLASTLYTDYTDLRGTPPETISKQHFVELRRAALESLATHHLVSNIEIQLNGARGEAKASMVIYRRNLEGEVFNTHCVYTLGVERTNQRWVIHSIVQKVLWNDGQKSIHRGVPQRDA